MIVNYREEGWQIISQRAHGLLAGQICFQWKSKNRPERWLETIIATAEHDDVFNEFDGDALLLNENGSPVNYKMRQFERDKCEELLHHALTKSRYIALLTSRHMRFLYEDSEDEAARKYTTDLKAQDNIWMKEIGISEKEISKAYAILEWSDALSLLLCQNLVPPENRKIEISAGAEKTSHMLHSPAYDKLIVEPWPFESKEFTISFESRTIKQLAFKDVQEFRKILESAPLEMHSYTVSKN